jgi:hypothetical protein
MVEEGGGCVGERVLAGLQRAVVGLGAGCRGMCCAPRVSVRGRGTSDVSEHVRELRVSLCPKSRQCGL